MKETMIQRFERVLGEVLRRQKEQAAKRSGGVTPLGQCIAEQEWDTPVHEELSTRDRAAMIYGSGQD